MSRWCCLILLLLTACAAPSAVSVTAPAEKNLAAKQRDVVECQALASHAAQGEGSWTSVPAVQHELFSQARDRWFLACMRSRGYVITGL